MSERISLVHRIWREFHWAFFLNVQGLIIALNRFEALLDDDRLEDAEVELYGAETLLVSSAASMELAASFSREAYETSVRVSMTRPKVASDDFSGLMSWEHAVLISVWRRLRPKFADLPPQLSDAHSSFVAAYRRLAKSHAQVCSRFVSTQSGSLRYEDRSAVETLRRFEKGRTNLIDPQRKGCPVDP
ncbi:siderophore biosynthesis protein [Fulvimarina sp. MAC8]|uniref:siderophore biosynthesis protein n=1 Tax=Fulvimarina sp. MAC8 TaxID=3162874 RepID=UPI0032EC34F1